MTSSTSPLRIAVIGSGVSGLSAAWLLNKRHRVTLYEAADRLGGHSNTVYAREPDGEAIPIDTGFIVFNERTYPNLTALFAHLGVNTLRSDMSFGVSLDHGAFEYASNSTLSYLRDPRTVVNPRFWAVVSEVLRFYRTGPAQMRALAGEGLSLGKFLDACGYNQAFQRDHLLPQAAAIWSCSVHEIADYPASAFIAFCDTHGLMQFRQRPKWRTVEGGSQAYVKVLAKGLETRLSTPVSAIIRDGKGVTVKDAHGGEECFDHVVIASHADQALKLLAEPTPEERRLLGAFRYSRNLAVLHQDARMMPKRRAWWSSWNYLGRTGDHSEATVTYWMNLLQQFESKQPYFVTLNPPEHMELAGEVRREAYEHPIFDGPAMAAQRRLWSLQGGRCTWFCGAHFGAGFHEDGLQAGLAVAEELGGMRRPWTVADESSRIFLHGVAPPWREPKLAA
ncbi:MAG: NAD(P)/FAD-dependent oxidoreductase [Caulobacteraceae bacterium]